MMIETLPVHTPPHSLRTTHFGSYFVSLHCLSTSPLRGRTGGSCPGRVSLTSDYLRTQAVCQCQGLFLAGHRSQHSDTSGFTVVFHGWRPYPGSILSKESDTSRRRTVHRGNNMKNTDGHNGCFYPGPPTDPASSSDSFSRSFCHDDECRIETPTERPGGDNRTGHLSSAVPSQPTCLLGMCATGTQKA